MTLAVIFTTLSIQNSLPPKLLQSVCWIESKHKITAVHKDDGGEDSVGICQLHYSTAKWLGFKGSEKELYDPKINIRYAAKYLKYNLKRYKGNLHKAITAYNRGNARSLLKSKYSEKVMKKYQEIK